MIRDRDLDKSITICSIKENDQVKIIELIDCCRPYVLPHHEYLYWIIGHYYNSTCFVCKDGNEFVGFISGLPSLDQKSIFIWQICVHPDYRKLNLGYKMIAKVYERLAKFNFTSIQFSIDSENIPSYKLFENFAKKNNLQIKAIDSKKICSSNEIAYEIRINY